MNFKIIENKNTINYTDFKKDFTNPSMNVKSILRKYNMSRKQYDKLRRRTLQETGMKRKPYTTTKNKTTRIIKENTYIQKQNNKYFIQKKINGKRKSFGTYKDITTARRIRDRLIQVNWNTHLAEKYKKQYGVKPQKITEALEKEKEFQDLYLKRTKSKIIKEKLNLTDYQYIRLSKIIREKNNIKGRVIK